MVTAPGSGAETIPFLKTWVNLPMAIGFTVIYAKVHFYCCQLICHCFAESAAVYYWEGASRRYPKDEVIRTGSVRSIS